MRLIEATVTVNDTRKQTRARKVIGSVHGKKIGVLDLIFKPMTDGMRGSHRVGALEQRRDPIPRAWRTQRS